jgi:hypothetical protein
LSLTEFAHDLSRIPPQIKDLTIRYRREVNRREVNETGSSPESVLDPGRSKDEQEDIFSVALRDLMRRLRHLTLENAIIGSELFWPRESGRVPRDLAPDFSNDGHDEDGLEGDDVPAESDDSEDDVELPLDKGKGVATDDDDDWGKVDREGIEDESLDQETEIGQDHDREEVAETKHKDKGKGVARDNDLAGEEHQECLPDAETSATQEYEDGEDDDAAVSRVQRYDFQSKAWIDTWKRKRSPLDDELLEEAKRRSKGEHISQAGQSSQEAPQYGAIPANQADRGLGSGSHSVPRGDATQALATNKVISCDSEDQPEEDEEDLSEPFSGPRRWAPTLRHGDLYFPELETLEVSFPTITPGGTLMMPPPTTREPNEFLFDTLFHSAAFMAQRAPRLRKLSLASKSTIEPMWCPQLDYVVESYERSRHVPAQYLHQGERSTTKSYTVRKASLTVDNFDMAMDPTLLAWKTANAVHTAVYEDENAHDEQAGRRTSTDSEATVVLDASSMDGARRRVRGPTKLQTNLWAVTTTGRRWMGGLTNPPDPHPYATAPPPRGPPGPGYYGA